MRRPRSAYRRWLLKSSTAAIWTLRGSGIALLCVPIALIIFLSFSDDPYTLIPPTGYSLRWYHNIFAEREFIDGFIISLCVALIVTPISVVVGTLSAYSLWRWPSPLARPLEQLLLSPLMLPLVVTGLALLLFYSHIGSTASFWNIVVAHVIITFPFSFRAVLAVLSRYDRQLDEAAASLRVSPRAGFVHVTLPLIRPGLFAGALFAFVMSFDDFAVTIFLIDPGTRTLPIVIYQYMEWNLDPTVSAVSAILILMTVSFTLLIEKVMGLDRFLGIRN